jgi:hypothetical protein
MRIARAISASICSSAAVKNASRASSSASVAAPGTSAASSAAKLGGSNASSCDGDEIRSRRRRADTSRA